MVKITKCDKCGKELVVSMVKNKEIDTFKEGFEGFGKGVFDEFFGEMPEFRKEIEGSIIMVNLPKYKVNNKTYDLCEKCTKIFLKDNIQKWLKDKQKGNKKKCKKK